MDDVILELWWGFASSETTIRDDGAKCGQIPIDYIIILRANMQYLLFHFRRLTRGRNFA